ncbi:MAG: hypothetical protein KJ907_10865 [Actinobacteria bacterium]|nr:hypothetical protein [Actinomycetota bacterium]MBU4403217.1 hypothetical protein [Actinomycetota bacterium]
MNGSSDRAEHSPRVIAHYDGTDFVRVQATDNDETTLDEPVTVEDHTPSDGNQRRSINGRAEAMLAMDREMTGTIEGLQRENAHLRQQIDELTSKNAALTEERDDLERKCARLMKNGRVRTFDALS